VYALFSGVMDRITTRTWVAVGLVVLEGVVLVASGWTCPLTLLAERPDAVRGSLADRFLPKWFADRPAGDAASEPERLQRQRCSVGSAVLLVVDLTTKHSTVVVAGLGLELVIETQLSITTVCTTRQT
jgi:hypothetical protein